MAAKLQAIEGKSRLTHSPNLQCGDSVGEEPVFGSSNHRPLILELAAAMKSDGLNRLPKQFVIARTLPAQFKHWQMQVFSGWTIAHAAELPLLSVLGQTGECVGMMIGWVIQKGELLRHGGSLQIGQGPHGEDINETLADLCGRFICLYKENGHLWATTDAGGLLSVVFSQSREALASTPTVLRAYGQLDVDGRLAEAFGIPERYGWYPFGLTPFKGVSRLLPNHAICLDDWQIKRIWPTNGAYLSPGKDPGQTTALIADKVQSNVGAVVKEGRGYIHLTAGFDSRMVLAASRPYIGSSIFETIRSSSLGTRLDCLIAAALAKRFGLAHEFLDFVEPGAHEVNSWLWRTGYCIYDAVTQLAATIKKYDRRCHSLTGTCGEIGRAYYWSAADINGDEVDAQTLVERLKLPVTAITLTKAEKWLVGLPVSKPSLIWDLAYIEQRLGCWGGPSVYGHDVSHPSLSPFNSRNIYKNILSLPEEYRCSHDFVRAFIKRLWPDLLQVPFNQAYGLRRLLFLRAEISRLLPNNVKRLIKKYGG